MVAKYKDYPIRILRMTNHNQEMTQVMVVPEEEDLQRAGKMKKLRQMEVLQSNVINLLL